MSFLNDIFNPPRPSNPVFHFPSLPVVIPPPPVRSAPSNPFRIPIAPPRKKKKTASDVFIEYIAERTGEAVSEVVEEVGAPIRRTAEAIESAVEVLTGSDDPTSRDTMTHTEPKKKKKNKITDTTDEDRTEATEERPVDTAPARPPAPPVPDEPVHVDDPVDNTGEQVPECNNSRSGNRLLMVGGADCHDRQVNPTAQGGGSHSGRDGSKTHAGIEGVDSFDSGGKRSYLARQANPVLKSINLINALQDPYGEFRKCKSEKRIVE